ncbi:hypothetical protein D9M68_670110 [compost metagenome]
MGRIGRRHVQPGGPADAHRRRQARVHAGVLGHQSLALGVPVRTHHARGGSRLGGQHRALCGLGARPVLRQGEAGSLLGQHGVPGDRRSRFAGLWLDSGAGAALPDPGADPGGRHRAPPGRPPGQPDRHGAHLAVADRPGQREPDAGGGPDAARPQPRDDAIRRQFRLPARRQAAGAGAVQAAQGVPL